MAGARNVVRLDLNSPEFQDVFFRLESAELKQVVAFPAPADRAGLERLYRHTGFQWEATGHIKAPNGAKTYSLRLSQKIRTVAYHDATIYDCCRCTPTTTQRTKRRKRKPQNALAHEGAS